MDNTNTEHSECTINVSTGDLAHCELPGVVHSCVCGTCKVLNKEALVTSISDSTHVSVVLR